MAISVISSGSASAAPALAGMASADTSSSAGFADLLFSQLGAAIAASDANSGKSATEKEQPAGSDPLSTDPALAFLMSNPAIQPPLTGKPDAASSSSDANLGALAGAGNGATQGAEGNAGGNGLSLPSSIDGKAGASQLPAASSNTGGDALAKSFAETLGQKTSTSGSALSREASAKAANAPPAISAQAEQAANSTLATSALSGKISEAGDSTANIAVESPLTSASGASLPVVANQAGKAEATAQAKSEVASPLHSSAWSHDFSNKVVWLAKNDQQQAQININPPQLGPIQITLNVNGDQATAVFTSAHAEVRQAIENSLPQLKEMLSSAGINLGQADVGSNQAQQQRDASSSSPNGTRLANETAILPGDGNAGDNKISTPLQRGRGLVDLFA